QTAQIEGGMRRFSQAGNTFRLFELNEMGSGQNAK
ncbi:MAG: hypothetical protein ACI9ZD_002145, partial [Paracoccaceae bacterium]